MAAELQSYMARRGVKAFMVLFMLSCLALISKYYRPDTSSSYYRRALFYRNDSSLQQGQFNSHFSWTDGNGKFYIVLVKKLNILRQ